MNTRLLGTWMFVGGWMMALAGCATLPDGSGKIVSESRTVEAFTGVAIDSGLVAEITMVPGAARAVTVSGDDNLVDYVRTGVEGGVLRVRLPDGTINPNGKDHLHITITAPVLTSLEAEGAADVTAKGIAAGSLSLESNGAARLEVLGEAHSVDAHASGSGQIEALSLAAHDVVARGEGGGDLAVCADGHLDLRLSGGSHALYGCDPAEVTKDISGGASAEEAE